MVAALWLPQPMPDVIVLSTPRTGPEGDAAPLVVELVEEARDLGYRCIRTRQEKEQTTPALWAALADAGFVVAGERVEYESPLADLPGERGSPLT